METEILGRVGLLPRRARPFFGRHPWVYPGAIGTIEGNPQDGDTVELVTNTGQFVAWGLFNSQSKIRVRLYSWEKDQPIDRALFKERLESAYNLRKRLQLTGPHQACRLVFSEADGLSGCTIDKYGQWFTLQLSSVGLAKRLEMITDLLIELFQPAGIYLRTERGIGLQEGLEAQDRLLTGKELDAPIVIQDGGMQWLVNIQEGQKTGFYLDQRDNRLEVARLAQGKRVLDAFCYSGGFGLQASRAGAFEVVCVDSSEPALKLAAQNSQLNNLDRIQFVKSDIFTDLTHRVGHGEQFGLVVLDPPKFARTRAALDDALRAYRRLMTLAIHLLEPDGILVFCCCTGLVTIEMLEELLSQISAEEKRGIQILQRRGPSPDHPVSVSCFQTHYLKCLICRVY